MLKSKSSYVRAKLFELMLILIFIHTLESSISRGANAGEWEGEDTSTALSRVCEIEPFFGLMLGTFITRASFNIF